MVRIITVDDIKTLIRKVTLETLFTRLIEKLEDNFNHWQDFEKMPRLASHFEQGVIELMPLWGKDYYSFKYVNGHPRNPEQNKQTVIAVGMLSDVATGYPVLISEMTLLTAVRTAATSALAMKWLSKKKPKVFALIGTGAQGEFQVLAHKTLLNIETVKYYDRDPKAMEKFEKNLSHYPIRLIPCQSIEETLLDADIITTATAEKRHAQILKDHYIQPGMTINALGGDCPGKTELEPKLLQRGKVVIEYIEQSKIEGEIQNYDPSQIYAELWEITSGKKPGRTSENDIMIFDSVGFGLEDYTILKLVYSLAEDFHVGHMLDMTPEISDPKNLFGLLK